MSEQNPRPDQLNNEPLIPPLLLLGISVFALFVAFAVFSTQSNSTLGFAALGIAAISLLAWAVMNPQDVKNFITGRGLSFGGTALVVTAVLIVASVLVYNLVKGLSLRQDFSETDTYSLKDDVRTLIETMTADPTIPAIRIIGFTTAATAGEQDRVEILLNDFQEASNGKISYEFIDINRNPRILEVYGEDLRAGQYVVVPLDANNEALVEQAEIVPTFDQFYLTNALISATASGDFKAHVLTVQNGVDFADNTATGADSFAIELRERFKWTIEDLNPLFLTGDTPQVTLGADTLDGEVVLIPGGTEALPDDVLQPLTDYVNQGGDLVVFGAISLEGTPTLATAENLSTYLWDNFGVRMRNDFVIDQANIVLNEFFFKNFGTHPITQGFIEGDGVVLQGHSIEISPSAPENVTVTVLFTTSDTAYSKNNLNFSSATSQDDFNAMLEQTPEDLAGLIPLAVAAENTSTGARVVLFGGENLLYNTYRSFTNAGVINALVARQAVFWASNYEDFVGTLATIANLPDNQPATIFITDERTRWMGFVVLFVLPFGLLFTGLGVLWLRRERREA